MRRFAITLLLVACSSSGEEGSADGGAGAPGAPLVSGLAATGLSLYQAVGMPLLPGQPIEERAAPVVQGRGALVRVFVKPEPGWQAREVTARLALSDSGGSAVRELTRSVSSPSWEPDLGSTFNFDLPGEAVTADLALSVSLHEVPGVEVGPESEAAVFPGAGALALGARSVAPLRVVLVPIRYDADGSGRLPELGEAQMALYRDAVFRLYPAAAVELRVRDPMPWSQAVSADGSGWNELHQAVISQRNKDRLAGSCAVDEYYFGLFSPEPSFDQYCAGGGCDLGQSFVIDADEEYLRSGLGLGFAGQASADTLAHELGHLHGRLHAPCGAYSDTDPDFPVQNGGIGTWGYDLLSGQLFDPESKVRDFMGYCDPVWIGGYNYSALFERMAQVGIDAGAGPGTSAQAFLLLSLSPEGDLGRGPTLWIDRTPRGAPLTLDVLNASGAHRRWQKAHLYRYSHGRGGLVLIPRPGPTDFALRLGVKTLTLR